MSINNSGRLLSAVRPVSYAINLVVSPEEKTFSGTVLIELHFESPARVVTLHALDLDISAATLASKKGAVSLDPAAETLTISFNEPIPAGPASLTLSFSGILNRQMRGLYETKSQGETYAFTQFQATDARRMFPCFDEPAFKARFRLKITIPAALQGLSNMPVISEQVEGDLKHLVFGETPVMSTYLLALGVARLEKKSIRIGETEVAIWTIPGQLALGGFALKVTSAVLPLLNDYFDLPCPTPKLDLVSVPDFAMGAMENWGAIFFRDSCLLLDESLSSTETQRRVASVITHEIVHQWFGNLVTMVWWDDLWLNESFATWLACKIVDQWRPKWHFWWTFQQEKEIPLELDALENSRAIHSEVHNAAEIEEMFDVLTYEKGGACLRMIEQFLGEAVFRDGIRRYMKQYQYQNATAADLWSILEEVSGQPVSAITKDWFTRPGFPLVTFSATDKNLGQFEVIQKRFFAGDEKETPPWTIPLRIKYRDDSGIQIKSIVFEDRQSSLDLSSDGPVQWLYGNGGESGFYRTSYSPDLMQDVSNAVLSDFSSVEKIGVLDNFWALSRRGDLPISFFMETLRRFDGEKPRVLIANISAYLELLSRQLVEPSDRILFTAFVSALFGPLWRELGWDAAPGEDEDRRLMRADLLWVLGAIVQDEEILSELPRRQMRYLRKPHSIDPIMVTPLLRLCARSDGGKRFEQFLEKFEKSKTPEIRDQYLLALTDFNKPALARQLIDYTLSEKVRAQDAWKPMRTLLANPSVQGEVWDTVKNRWEQLREKCGSIGSQRIIQSARYLWSEKWHDDVRHFFDPAERRSGMGERAIAQTLEFIRLGIRFKAKQSAGLSDWLQKNVKKEEKKYF